MERAKAGVPFPAFIMLCYNTRHHERHHSPARLPVTQKLLWCWRIGFTLFLLWAFLGIRGLVQPDIPLLLFASTLIVLSLLPITHWVGCTPYTWRTLFVNFVCNFCVLLCLYLLLLFAIPPFAISPQTTYLTEPRAKDYYGIDYQAAIEQEIDPGVPSANNAFRPLFETFGKALCSGDIKDEHWNRFCQYLDLSSDLQPKQTYTSWAAYTHDLPPEEKEILEMAFSNGYVPFPDKMIPIVKRWLDENNSALEQFADAACKPIMYLPPTFNNQPIYFADPNNDKVFRTMVHNIGIRIRYYQTIKEIDKAWNDVMTIYRLAEHHRRAVWDFNSLLFYQGMVGTANRLAESIIIHGEVTSDEIQHKAAEILPFQQPYRDEEMKRVLRNGRLQALDTVRLFMFADDTNQNNRWSQFKNKNVSILFRRGYAMIEINRSFDEMERRFFSRILEPPEVDWNVNIFRFLAWHGEFVSGSILVGRFLGEMMSYDSFVRSFLSHHANTSLTQFVFTLEAYRRDKNKYPDSLDELQKDYLAEVPLDPFSGKPFRYVVEPANVLLYSVGANGIDDEGRNRKDTPKGDDLRRRLPTK